MGRPPLHTLDALLDGAVRLFADGGAEAVTMAAVARSIGAPSGSIYHRFPDRGSLLAALWLRTERGFLTGYREAIGDDPTPEEAVAAAVWCVEWCRANPGPAAVLQAGRHTLLPESWPVAAREEEAVVDAERVRDFAAVVRRVAARAKRPRDEVSFAMLELPLAVVRPHLQAGERVPAGAADRVRRLARRLLLD